MTQREPAFRFLSFFSGAMGLDLGLEEAGGECLLACEVDRATQATIRYNRPSLPLISDVSSCTVETVREAAGLHPSENIDLIVGGPPCQAFSTAGARRSFQDSRGNVFLDYIDLALALKPRFIVIENVRGLLSAPLSHTPHSERSKGWKPSNDERSGGALRHVLETIERQGYGVSFNLYNSANFGVPQVRERVILIASRDGKSLPFLMPTHSENGEFGLPKWKTFREAVQGIKTCTSSNFPESRLKYYRFLRSGQYWKHLPTDLQKEAMGKSFYSGGGKTGFYRRLDWDKPACTLVTSPSMPATDICHPELDRPLSIEEYKRVQQFPDEWEICGSLTDQYRQVGNAVPVGLGAAVGRLICQHIAGVSQIPPKDFKYSRYRNCDHVSWNSVNSSLGAISNSKKLAQPRFL
ncbi:DNA cytosine methyltransferase [Sandaracinobacter sp.]|uniref:DNA cytosine methyltransferase n=1 Tax=Sandaracinobacter sp. TaxID=2487581 RepID=UPI0035AE5079